MKRVEGSFKILIRNLRLNKNEKNLLPREESKDV